MRSGEEISENIGDGDSLLLVQGHYPSSLLHHNHVIDRNEFPCLDYGRRREDEGGVRTVRNLNPSSWLRRRLMLM